MQEIMRVVAELMAVAARTAPKAAGKDFVTTKIFTGDELSKIADAMLEFGKETGKGNFDRDGKNVRNSDAMLMIGLKDPAVVGLNCGACGFNKCSELKEREGTEFAGPICAWRSIDLGIAVGSAVKTASIHNVDNRIMYRAGTVVRKMGLMEDQLLVGIPISATGKSIYFDR